MPSSSSIAIPILRIGSTLIASVQIELKDTVAEAFQEDLLTEMERTGAQGLIIDISRLDVVDSYVARVLTETGRMARLMGASTVLVGMRPELAATLIRMRHPMEGVETALDLEGGLARLAELRAAKKGTSRS
jgi:rsbT antagonist protein RsbS